MENTANAFRGHFLHSLKRDTTSGQTRMCSVASVHNYSENISVAKSLEVFRMDG